MGEGPWIALRWVRTGKNQRGNIASTLEMQHGIQKREPKDEVEHSWKIEAR